MEEPSSLWRVRDINASSTEREENVVVEVSPHDACVEADDGDDKVANRLAQICHTVVLVFSCYFCQDTAKPMCGRMRVLYLICLRMTNTDHACAGHRSQLITRSACRSCVVSCHMSCPGVLCGPLNSSRYIYTIEFI